MMELNLSQTWRFIILLYHHCLLSLILFTHLGCLAQHVEMSYRVKQTEIFGPVVEIRCSSEILRGLNQEVRWEFGGRTLAQGSRLIDADPSRYNVTQDGHILVIRNAIKNDGGLYTCYIYDSTDNTITKSMTTHVMVGTYLPATDFPRCSIHPNLTFTSGGNLTFGCAMGESSNAGIELELMLKRRDGSYKSISSETLQRTATLEDSGSTYICKMRSSTFPTALRHCISGPIMLKHKRKVSTPPAPLLSKIHAVGTSHNESEDQLASPKRSRVRVFLTPRPPQPPEKDHMGAMLGAVFGAIFLFFLIIVVYFSEAGEMKSVGAGPSGDNRKDAPLEITMISGSNNTGSSDGTLLYPKSSKTRKTNDRTTNTSMV
ncbi:uncharacterized protein [Amphiura filiformis]|uniref:uncharacterized protein n=1 Tax=Amphiura filiformis TaxID=82378 RepID=UPI003B20C6BD